MTVKTDDIKFLLEDLRKQKENLEKREKLIVDEEEKLKSVLTKASIMTVDEARKELLNQIQKELASETARLIRNQEERVKLDAAEKSKEILVDSMKHGATSYTAEYTVSTVEVPNEEVKGRIIGSGGRNIRAFEKASGVELEIDEGNEIRLSSFDPIRREIARISLIELIKDSRIQPSRIEEVIKQSSLKIDDILVDEGKRISQECGVFNLPLDVIKLLGRYKFRTSYGQNLAIHTIEETKIGVAISNEIGANTEVVRLGCLLHDIGKVVSDEEGTHVEKGVAVLKRFGFSKNIVSCVAEHHEDKPFTSIESTIVWIADAISGSRPGARYEPHEDYIKRMSKIEEIAKGFPGVSEVYAFQAGRDVRVVVNPDEIDDDKVTVIAHDIAKRLEKEAEYAGLIKVTVIREVRAVDTTSAK